MTNPTSDQLNDPEGQRLVQAIHDRQSQRDELAKVIYTSHRGNTQVDLLENRRLQGSQLAWARLAADTLIAAGYRKPRTITTAEELDALPKMSVVRDDFGGVFQRQTKFVWTRQNKVLDYEAYDIELPATVLYEPEATK